VGGERGKNATLSVEGEESKEEGGNFLKERSRKRTDSVRSERHLIV